MLVRKKRRDTVPTGLRIVGLLLLCWYGAGSALGQEPSNPSVVPDALLRPQRGEAPRYPQDTVLGPLGRGEAAEAAYTQARNFLAALLQENQETSALSDVDAAAVEALFKALEPIKPQKFRIGGGREEPDESVSFLVRFVGREQWITGELYLRLADTQWQVEELILEEPRDMSDGTDSYPYDYSPYERFF